MQRDWVNRARTPCGVRFGNSKNLEQDRREMNVVMC
jgi:hypothetical protein